MCVEIMRYDVLDKRGIRVGACLRGFEEYCASF